MSTLDRTKRPASGQIRSFDFPAVDRRALANGLDLRVAQMTRLPVVSAKLFVRAGEIALGPERAGLSVLTGDALDGGTERRSGSELAEAIEGIGARLSVAAGWEGTSIGLSCLADRLPAAMAILAETVIEPSFPQEEVDRAKEQHLAGIRQRAMDPAAAADDAALPRYFAAGVPYARPVDGTAGSVGDYGFLPRTLGDDDDPLDVLVMTTEPTFPGCLITVRPIGVFRMEDEKGGDEKILSVPVADPLRREIREIEHVPPHYLDEVRHFFSVYKDLEGKHVRADGWGGRSEAERIVLEAVERYATTR